MKAIALALLLAACGGSAPCPTEPGNYELVIIAVGPLARTACFDDAMNIDTRTPALLAATCEPGCVCTTDLTEPSDSCAPRTIFAVCPGAITFSCTLYPDASGEPMSGSCAEGPCAYDAVLSRVDDRTLDGGTL